MAYSAPPDQDAENVWHLRNGFGTVGNQTSMILETLNSYNSRVNAHHNGRVSDVDSLIRTQRRSPSADSDVTIGRDNEPLTRPPIYIPQVIIPQPMSMLRRTGVQRPMSLPQTLPLAQAQRSMYNIGGDYYSTYQNSGNSFAPHAAYNVDPLHHFYRAIVPRPAPTYPTGVSANYQGDPYLPANQSANIPDELNTAVWITNLPPNVDHRMLLDSVRNCGKIFAAVINGPERGHITAASKLVFFDVAGAQKLMEQARDGKFTVGDYVPRVRHNRIKSAEKDPGPQSRVLHIEGPSCIVNQPYLAALFRGKIMDWQDEIVLTLWTTETLTRLEWRFGSFRCQADTARNIIDRTKRSVVSIEECSLWQAVTVHYGVDPCAPKHVVDPCVPKHGVDPYTPKPTTK